MKNGKTCFGVIIGTRAYFNSELAKDVRKQLLKTLDEGGYEYIILPEDATPTGSSSIETREDGLKVSKQFRQHRDEIDGIIVSLPNFGFEIGIINAISDADLNVPVMVQACDDQNDKVDLDSRRDAFCGKISVCNNLYQYGIPFTDTTLHTYSIYDPLLKKDIDRFAAVCRVVNGLRHCRLGQIGTRPLGFNTCRASEKLLQRSGITVVPADLSEILYAAQKIQDDDPKFIEMCNRTCNYAKVPDNYKEKLGLQAKFSVAVENWIEANDVQAVAIQCWDSLEQNYGCAPCVTMSMLSDKLIPAACETDLAGAVSMYALSFTFFRISTDDPKGIIKAYLGKGQITNDPYGMDGCIAVTKVDNLQKLMKYICKNGFEHHVAMCRTDVVDILNEAIETYLGWDLYVHN